METFTFYSYKGGVGRTLTLTNIAIRLAEIGKKVCVLDFDLEAPGVLHKFDPYFPDLKAKQGIVDYISYYINNQKVPENISDYFVDVYNLPNINSFVKLLPAGNDSSKDYWSTLSKINWHELLYKTEGDGIRFFLDLKEKIKNEINPDFLLIDSRTGISDISGIALALLSNNLVVFATNNEESIIGSSQILSSLCDKNKSIYTTSPKVHFVLSRIPYPNSMDEKNDENILTEKFIAKLNNDLKRIKCEQQIHKINIIHSERELEKRESFLIGYDYEREIQYKYPISDDYLQLFDNLVSGLLSPDEIQKFINLKHAYMLINKSIQEKDEKKKISLALEAKKLSSDNMEIILHIGRIYGSLKDNKNALKYYNIYLKSNPNSLEALYSKAITLIKIKPNDVAYALVNEIINKNPDKVDGYLLKHLFHKETNNKVRILDDLNKILEIAPNNAIYYNARAMYYKKQKDYKLALKDIYKAISIKSRSWVYYSTLAEIKAALKEDEEFFLFFELALVNNIEDINTMLKEPEYKRFFKNPRFINLLRNYNFNEVAENLVSNSKSKSKITLG